MQKAQLMKVKAALIYITKLIARSLPIDQTNKQHTEIGMINLDLLKCFIGE